MFSGEPDGLAGDPVGVVAEPESISMKAFLMLALMLLIGVPAYADSTTPKGESAEEKLAKKEELDAGKVSGLTRYDLGIWTLVVFGLLFLLLSKTAWKPIMVGLQKREDTIAGYRNDAEAAKLEAEKLLAEVKAQRAKASEDVAAILAEARRDAEVFRDAEKARTGADIQAERDRLKREIESARDQALSEIWDKTVELATLVSTKAIGRSVSTDDHRRLIDESLTELNERISKA